MADYRYVIYDGSKDKIMNSFKIYNDGYMYCNIWQSKRITKIIDYGGIIIAIDHYGCILYNKTGGREVIGPECLCCVVCDEILYRWYKHDDTNMRLWSSPIDNLFDKTLIRRKICPWDSPISLIKYFDVPINLCDINYGKDIMADHNSRGVKIIGRFVDVIICCD